MRKTQMTGIEMARRMKGLTQRDLAKILGVTQANISHWETGKSSPTVGNLYELSKILNTSMEDLLK